MVEAWRLNKHVLYADIAPDVQLHMFLLFTDNKLPDYETVLKAVVQVIEKLKRQAPFIPAEVAAPPIKAPKGKA